MAKSEARPWPLNSVLDRREMVPGGVHPFERRAAMPTTVVRSSAGAILSVLLFFACDAAQTPASATRQQLPENGSPLLAQSVAAQTAIGLPSWIVEPSTLPSGRVGKNNCTFPFGANVPQWDFHSDAGCWEHSGPDGWTRQQFQRLHVPNFAACGGRPGDATAIRVCRPGGAGQASPCLLDASTGPTGCVRCIVNPTCH